MGGRSVLRIWLFGGWSFNLVWEIAQRPLYGNYFGLGHHLWGCFMASLGDVMILGVLFGFMATASSSWCWYEGNRVRWVPLAGAGATIATTIEYRALHLGEWFYADSMPLVPVLDIGVSPILQMVLGPVALAFLSARAAPKECA